MVNFPGAILVKNGQATTCEFGLIDNQAAFVAASCLDYTSNGNLNTSTSYEIFFSATTDHDASKASISSKDIHIHPHYDPTTLADNIAVVQYDFRERGGWVNYIAVYKSEWTSQYYVRRRLYDASKQSWWGAYVNGYTGSAPTCSTLSPLYAQNTDTILCNQIQTSSAWNKNCPMPYGSIYGIVSEGMAIGGLYSHSLMFSADYCSGTRGLYHFVLLGNYVNWGESVIQRNINKLVHDTAAYANSAQSSSYSMADVANPNPSGMHIYAGNLVSPVAWSPNEAGALASSITPSGSGGTSISSLSVSNTPGKEIDDSAGANTSVSDAVAGGTLGSFNTADNNNNLSGVSAGSEPTPNSSGGIPDDNMYQDNIDTNTNEYLNPADHTSMFPQPTYIVYTDFSDSENGDNNSGNVNGSESANNIAIIQFNPDQEVKWTNPIAVNRDSWSDTVLSRRYVKKRTNSVFESPLTESLSVSEDKCLSNSGLYAANTKDFVCSYQMTRPLQSSQCNTPYGSVYGIQSNIAAVAGLYSYSVISNSQFCASASTVSYYLLLADYIAFAKDAIGRDVTLAFGQGFVVNNVITYSMSALSFSSPNNTYVITGNLFATDDVESYWVYGENAYSTSPQNSSSSSGSSSGSGSNLNNNQNVGSSSSGFNPTSGDSGGLFAGFNTDSEIESVDGSTEGSNNSPISGVVESESSEDNRGSSEANAMSGEIKDQTDNRSSGGKSGLSGGEIAAMVVCLLIGIVLIVSGLFFGSRLYRQYRLRKRWAPDTVQNIVETHAVDNELGNAVEKKFELPSYRHHRRTMLVAAGPTSPR
ncbi:hypothetical protein EV177_006895 [Coemansia sp. RSA 1804]|nr:hypothetical protein EV177_006895 [Coemansia sp. RSA 1804]